MRLKRYGIKTKSGILLRLNQKSILVEDKTTEELSFKIEQIFYLNENKSSNNIFLIYDKILLKNIIEKRNFRSFQKKMKYNTDIILNKFKTSEKYPILYNGFNDMDFYKIVEVEINIK
jgi:hypothetical protein